VFEGQRQLHGAIDRRARCTGAVGPDQNRAAHTRRMTAITIPAITKMKIRTVVQYQSLGMRARG
jgi:hypothetical protein